MTIDELKTFIHNQGELWGQDSAKWQQPSPKAAIMFMVTEAAEALSSAISADDPGFIRNNPDKIRDWEATTEEVADTIIMALRYFGAMGLSVESAVLAKLEKMARKRNV